MVKYYSGKELFRDTWKYGTKQQKSRVLKSMGLHSSWSQTKSPDEMVKRGGGIVVKDLGRLFDKYVEKNPGIDVRWNKKR